MAVCFVPYERRPLTFSCRRYKQALINLAKKDPVLGGKKLSEELFNSLMAVHQSMPPGHVFQVCQ
jgi:hypothetical protein